MIRQLSAASFFTSEEESDLTRKMIFPPITNLGCEGEFSTVGNDFKHAGGSTSLKTVSNKHMISRNKLFDKDRWIKLSEYQKRAKWKWSTSSNEAKVVRKMEEEFVKRVEAVEKLALQRKTIDKNKIHQKLTDNIKRCKEYGGPLTQESIEKIHSLSFEQVKDEAGFLKKTTAPNIRYKRKINGKMVDFTFDELKQQVIDAIKPAKSSTSNVDDLLKGIFQSIADKEEPAKAGNPSVEVAPKPGHPVDLLGWWQGPLGEMYLGLVVDETTFQLHDCTWHGFQPFDLPKDIEEDINVYHYIACGSPVFLIKIVSSTHTTTVDFFSFIMSSSL